MCREHPGTTIVTDSVTSNGLSDFIAGLGGRHFRFQRGYKNVINKGIALAKEGVDCQLMMETRCSTMSLKSLLFRHKGLRRSAAATLDGMQSNLSTSGAPHSTHVHRLLLPYCSVEIQCVHSVSAHSYVQGRGTEAAGNESGCRSQTPSRQAQGFTRCNPAAATAP